MGGGPCMYVCVYVTCLCVCAFVPQSCSLSILFQTKFVTNQITRVKGNHVTSDSDIDAPRSVGEENKTIKGPMPLMTAWFFCLFLFVGKSDFILS